MAYVEPIKTKKTRSTRREGDVAYRDLANPTTIARTLRGSGRQDTNNTEG